MMNNNASDLEEQCALQWLVSKREAYPPTSHCPIAWLDRLTHLLNHAILRNPVPEAPLGSWQLSAEGSRLQFLLSERPLKKKTLALMPVHEDQVNLMSLIRLDRAGVRRVWFFHIDHWKQWDVRALIADRILYRLSTLRRLPAGARRELGSTRLRSAVAQIVVTLCGHSNSPSMELPVGDKRAVDVWPTWIASEACASRVGWRQRQPFKVVHTIGSLFSGGAERQLCNLAISQRAQGHEVQVMTQHPCEGNQGHYAHLLKEQGVGLSVTTDRRGNGLKNAPWFLFQRLPVEIRGHVIALAAAMTPDPPDVLHCWLDEPNIVGAIAGFLAGVPHIVLSTRNTNPTNLPRIDRPYYPYWYQLASQSRRVHFIANSHNGALSYAEWLGLPVERFHVVFNGISLDHFPKPTPEERLKARAVFGLNETDPVVCGVFRLDAEKQPGHFLEVVRRTRIAVPKLQVLLSGEGEMSEQVAAEVRSTGMTGYTRLLGRRSDVANVYLASDACLLTSRQEGCPNVALESQYLRTPMIATTAGGTPDSVLHGGTGFLAGVDDVETLTEQLVRVLTDRALHGRLANAGPGFITSRFGLKHMVDQTRLVYEVARSGDPHQRVLPEGASTLSPSRAA